MDLYILLLLHSSYAKISLLKVLKEISRTVAVTESRRVVEADTANV
jgi:hypothetical protein